MERMKEENNSASKPRGSIARRVPRDNKLCLLLSDGIVYTDTRTHTHIHVHVAWLLGSADHSELQAPPSRTISH